ncbi:hypothetical protein M0812_02104 [Anaeramoeba flamelloides]|uniref:Uncharacterized protein n=1 Tax=Anaeramoeba flamelloides TaxID=1746091 RepID=A0AAV7Z1G0_9EUKA|nr:hypothetical protein M0812_02104 [Anaeramoeba flamelloides]
MNLSLDKSNGFELKRRRRTKNTHKKHNQGNTPYIRSRKRVVSTTKINKSTISLPCKAKTKKTANTPKGSSSQTQKSILDSNFDIFKDHGFGFAKPTSHPYAKLNLENKILDYEKHLFPKDKFTILKSVEVELRL